MREYQQTTPAQRGIGEGQCTQVGNIELEAGLVTAGYADHLG
jgi:hypothetical protein